MSNTKELSPGWVFLIKQNIEHFHRMEKLIGSTESDLNENRIHSICWIAWQYSNEDLHSVGITRSWLRLFISRLFCNRVNVAASDWRIEKALKI